MLSHLCISNLRNLTNIEFEPGAQFNLIVGPNGCGKTSVLEAIHLLGLGRSFRSHKHSSLIQYNSPGYMVHAIIAGHYRIGVEKKPQTKPRVRINGENQESAVELAQLLPLRLVDPQSFALLNEGPKARRRFLDWMVFHVEHAFYRHWREAQQIIQQRNAALKARLPLGECCIWDNSLAHVSNEINSMRSRCLEEFIPIANLLLGKLADFTVEIEYCCGWPEATGLRAALESSRGRDAYLGYTQYGPHRSDLKIRVNNHPAEEFLSRGQQKLLILALYLAQGSLLKRTRQKECLYLIDDLTAELDPENREKALEVLATMGAQVFITSVDLSSIAESPVLKSADVFHVEQLWRNSKVTGIES